MALTLPSDRFDVLGTLGRGAMGELLRVRDRHDAGREVALKRLLVPPEITPARSLAFREEYETMVRLRHPNTIEVHDYGYFDDGAPYCTMEVVDGQDLAALLRVGALPPPRCYEILLQLARTLAFMHARQYVHRDIKAENVRILADGTVKLMDFGLVARAGSPTRPGTATGSPATIAPEAIVGAVVDPASDLYSLGCLAFEMVTGTSPFEGSVGAVLHSHLHDPPPPLEDHQADVPGALREVIGRLMRKDPRQRYRSAAELASVLGPLAGRDGEQPTLAQKHSYLEAGRLVGREADLAVLEAALDVVRHGTGCTLFIGAEAGVGKSRLVQELTLLAKLGGVTVLQGTCREAGSAPYEVLAAALGPLLAGGRTSMLPGAAVLQRVQRPEGMLDRQVSEQEVAEAVTELVAGACQGGPLLLALDDLQWADAPTQRVLDHCTRAFAASPVLLVGAFRREELAADAPIRDAVAEGNAKFHALGPFEADQVAALLAAWLGDPAPASSLVADLTRATGGNAFFIGEVLRGWLEDGTLVFQEGRWRIPAVHELVVLPASVSSAVRRRLARLPTSALELAGVAAVLGLSQERLALVEIAGLGPAEFVAAFDLLVEHQFMQPSGSCYVFNHDIVRETLYEDLSADRRADLHRRCGLWLEAAAASGRRPAAAELAHHFVRGGDMARAFTYALQAGSEALASGATSLALGLWYLADEALDRLDRVDLEGDRLRLWELIGYQGMERAPTHATGALARMVALLQDRRVTDSQRPRPPFDDGDRLFVCHALLAAASGIAGRPRVGERHAALAAERLGTGVADDVHLAILAFAEGVNQLPLGKVDRMLELATFARDRLFERDLAGRPLAMLARMGTARLLTCAAYQGYRPAEDLLAFSLRAADQNGTPGYYNMLRHPWAVWNAWSGRLDAVRDYIAWADQNSRRLGAPPYQWALYFHPLALLEEGAPTGALAAISQALHHDHVQRDRVVLGLLHGLRGQALAAIGDDAAADASLEAAEAIARADDLGIVLMRVMLARGELALARRDHPGARRAAEAVMASAAGGPLRNPLHAAVARRQLADVEVAAGDDLAAMRHLDAASAVVSAPAFDNALEQAHGNRIRAMVKALRGDRVAALADMQGVRYRLDALGQRAAVRRLDAARLDLEAGPSLRRQPNPPVVWPGGWGGGPLGG